ncbi:putative mitochondrial intermediate peptidase mitochondrial precursor [Melampsora americana]|nr:putative mitochondrial intermediate peptidase mitochondrial precursor [Melampsora americana]
MFDRLSDGLCRMIDLAELLRNLHPDSNWIQASDQAHDLLCRYMNTLNTHRELYSSLDHVLNQISEKDQRNPKLFASRTVALQFLRDFRRHGIHLSSKERSKLVDLSDRMLILGRAFFSNSTHPSSLIEINKSEALMLGQRFLNQLDFNFKGFSEIDPMDWHGLTLLRQHPLESVRKRVWMSQNQSSESEIDVLETLLRTRYEFAKLTGRSNWGEVALEDKMASRPENVMNFLSQLSNKTKPSAMNELQELQRLKQKHISSSQLPTIYPWDRDYFANLITQSERTPSSGSVSPYFSVGRCIQGLSRLFGRIYGISFRVEAHQPEEVWDQSVVKIGVWDEDEGRIGTIYCDLFQRDGKTAGAAHYTVLCSRRTDLDDEEVDFDFLEPNDDQILVDDLRLSRIDCELLNVPVSERRNRSGTYQRPVVVFSCSFDPPTAHQPSLLNWSDVETLFHEMGHAMHSMIGQTEYHNVAGNKMSNGSSRITVNSDGTFHKLTRSYRIIRKTLEKRPTVIGQITPITFIIPIKNPISIQVKDGIQFKPEFGILPSIPNTSWQTRFGHLHGYGASYYSYLFDRAIAAKVWKDLFEDDSLCRESGERLKTELLGWGGGRDPWLSVGNLLGNDMIKEGGIEAIGLIGSWGLWKQ